MRGESIMESTSEFSDVSYSILKEDDHFSDIHVFSVTQGPLPSYIRTLSPKSRSKIRDSNGQGEENDERPYCLTNIRYLALLMTFLVTSILTVYIVTSKLRMEDLGLFSSNETKTVAMEYVFWKTNSTKTDADQYGSYNIKTHRLTPCVYQCTPYRGRRFDSQCVSGYCRCQGRYYQLHTCLPTVDSCIIERQTGSTYMDNHMVPSYSCRSSHLRTNIHVVGIYGNHFSENTVVNIRGHSVANVTVVLGSHYPVRWKVKYPDDIDIQSIVLVSDRNIRSRDVDLDWDSINYTIPVISHVRIPVGYGDDRHGMNTVKMVQIIRVRYGQINSFTGTEFADYIDVEIS